MILMHGLKLHYISKLHCRYPIFLEMKLVLDSSGVSILLCTVHPLLTESKAINSWFLLL